MAKIKQAGRPEGAPGKRSGYLRNVPFTFKGTEGLEMTIKALIATGNYKTKSDVIHEAIQQLAIKKLSEPIEIYWLQKIQ